MNDHKVPEKVS